MKSIIFFLIFILLLGPSSVLFGQKTGPMTTSDLTPEQEFQFQRLRLGVEVDSRLYFTIIDGTGGGGERRSINFYSGFSPVSESSFYRIAGFQEESQLALQHAQRKRTLSITLTALMGIGSGMMLLSLGFQENDSAFTGLLIGGGLVMLSSVIPITMAQEMGQTRFSVQQASAVADQHNRRILEQIMNP